MPITPSFSISQSSLSPNIVTATDTSTGSDAAIASRRIFFQTAQGTYLVEDGVTTDWNSWNYADAAESFDILDTDQSLAITVQWLSVANAVLYTLTQLFCLPQYNKNFYYYLIQQQALTPSILQDTVYFSNIATYWQNIIGAINAIEIGADIAASQNCLDRATLMKDNESKYF